MEKTNSVHASLTKDELIDEIESCQRVIEKIYECAFVQHPMIKYYRAGCGYVSDVMYKYCEDNGYTIVLGSNYCEDAHIPFKIINKFYIRQHMNNNDIIIIHDRKWTSSMLDELLSEIRMANVPIGTLII